MLQMVGSFLCYLNIINELADYTCFTMTKLDFSINLLVEEEFKSWLPLLHLLMNLHGKVYQEHLYTNLSWIWFRNHFGLCLLNAGDYELQATVMETIFRVSDMDQKKSYLNKWFTCENTRNAFMNIKNEEFETVCYL